MRIKMNIMVYGYYKVIRRLELYYTDGTISVKELLIADRIDYRILEAEGKDKIC